MNKSYSCGMLEFTSIASGIESADQMVKTAFVEPVVLKTICPGKFIVAVKGDVAAVTSAVKAGLECGGVRVVDWFTLANIHADVFPALSGVALSPMPPRPGESGGPGEPDSPGALGIIETYSAAATVLAGDQAAKTAKVMLLDIRMAMGLGGKGFLLLAGDVAAARAAVDAGAARAADIGLLVSKVVIPRPSRLVWDRLL